MASGRNIFLLAALLATAAPLRALDSAVQQLVVSVAPTWDSSEGKLQLFERKSAGWQAVSSAVPVLYGKNGLVWGRGETLPPPGATEKMERDKRAPAGIFALGKIYTYDAALPSGSHYPFHTISAWDAWIDDPANALYNQHVVVDPKNVPPWFAKQRMRLDDPPHRWLVEIRHNADPPLAGHGSAIFFHIRRGLHTPSAGCTVMSEDSLISMIRWLRTNEKPHYVLLPREQYLRLWQSWDLPDPQTASAVLGN